MKRLVLLCSRDTVAACAESVRRTIEQDTALAGLSLLWQGKTARHEIGLILIEGQEIPERLLDMIAIARDLFDFTGVFEEHPDAVTCAPAGSATGIPTGVPSASPEGAE